MLWRKLWTMMQNPHIVWKIVRPRLRSFAAQQETPTSPPRASQIEVARTLANKLAMIIATYNLRRVCACTALASYSYQPYPSLHTPFVSIDIRRCVLNFSDAQQQQRQVSLPPSSKNAAPPPRASRAEVVHALTNLAVTMNQIPMITVLWHIAGEM